MTLKFRNRSVLAGLLVVLTAACGGGSSSAGVAGAGVGGVVASIAISASTTTINPGETVTFNAVPTDGQGSVLSGVSFAWLSSDTAVATVSSGVAAGVAAGTASISASAGGVTSNLVALAVTGTPPPAGASDPTLGAHGLAFHVSKGSVGATLSTPAMNTQSGSTMLAFLGKGAVSFLSPPSDNKGNTPYVRVGMNHEYAKWPGEGTAMYAFNSIVGGAGHLVSVDDSNTFDEVSFATVEVRNGGVIQDNKWNEVLNSPTHTSQSVTTTGPATLVAAWFGDDASSSPSVATPNNGFTVIERVTGAVETVQMTVATRDVPSAGTYNVTWTATPRQGAQLYLVAVQKR